jgi:hypothetical protein
MRYVAALSVALSCITPHAAAFQARSGGAAGQPAIRACTVLTRDLVAPFTENKTILDLLPPEESPLAAGSGTACKYGAVRLQLFPGNVKRTMSAKDLQPVSGAGDGGLFRNNRDRYAELTVWTSKYNVDLQVSVPSGRTAEAIKPDVIALANAILKKLP